MPASRTEYTPLTWVNEETELSAENLNHIEAGVALNNALAIENALFIDEIYSAFIERFNVTYDSATGSFSISFGNSSTERFHVSKSVNIGSNDNVKIAATLNTVYGKDASGNEANIYYSSDYNNKSWQLVIRDANSDVLVPDAPTSDNGATSKKYVAAQNKVIKHALDKKLGINEYSGTAGVGYADVADGLTPYGENSGVEDSTPFVFQTAGGSSDISSKAYLRALRGNSVAFNQIQKISTQPTYTDNDTGLTITNNNDGSITISGTILATKSSSIYLTRGADLSTSNGRKYLTKLCSSSPYLNFRIAGQNNCALNTNVENKIWEGSSDRINNSTLNMGVSGGVGETINITIKPQTFDLTMLEQNGVSISSVEEFNRLFPKSYYGYNAGELISSKVNGIKNVGYNAFDGEWERGAFNSNGEKISTDTDNIRTSNPIKVIAGRTYTLENGNFTTSSAKQCIIWEYDDNLVGIKRTTNYSFMGSENNKITLTLSENTRYVKFNIYVGRMNLVDNKPQQFSFHLTWDGSRTGYEPHESHTYPLPNIELRSAGSVYDELKHDGTLTRKIGVVDLGSLTWTIPQDNRTNTFSLTDILPNTTNIRCSKYMNSSIIGTTETGKIAVLNKNVFIADTNFNGKTLAEIKALLSGVYLFYELETPTEEQNDDYKFQEVQNIDDFGTQEFLYDEDIDIPVPQGNDFFYPVDYKAFIDSLGGREDINYDAGQIVSHAELEAEYEKAIESKKYALRCALASAKGLAVDDTGCVDLGTLNWSYNSSYNYFSALISEKNGGQLGVCSKYVNYGISNVVNMPDKNFCSNANDGIVFIKDSNYNDASIFKNAMKGVLLAYEKA